MKKFGIVILTSVPSMAFAFDYPKLSNHTQQKFLELYIKDRNDLVKEDLFAPSSTKQEWPCPISQKEQNRLANLLLSKPLAIEDKSNTRKDVDNTPSKETIIINKNVQITPMKAECVNGKIMGEVELRTEYDSLLDQYSKNTSNNVRFISKIHNTTLSKGTIKDGTLVGTAKSFSKFITHLKIETSPNDSNKQFSDPIITLEMEYKDDIGNMASFTEETGFYITGGETQNLRSTFTLVIDNNHTQKITYKNNHISSIEPFKNGLPHGDQLGYLIGMDDKINLIEAGMPSSHPKLVTINGTNYIETHLCMHEGVEVDQFPCVVED